MYKTKRAAKRYMQFKRSLTAFMLNRVEYVLTVNLGRGMIMYVFYQRNNVLEYTYYTSLARDFESHSLRLFTFDWCN